MAGLWKNIVRRRRVGIVDCSKVFDGASKEDPVVLREKSTRVNDGTNKRATINLGVEDLPAGPRPESVAKFNTDDDLGLRSADITGCLDPVDDGESFGAFLIREYLRNEDAQRLGVSQKGVTWADKDSKLKERRKSLIVPDYSGMSQLRKKSNESGPTAKPVGIKRDALYLDILRVNVENKENSSPAKAVASEGLDEVFSDSRPNESAGHPSPALDENCALLVGQGEGKPPVAPPRKKRDARRRAAMERERNDSESTSSTPISPLSPLSSSVFIGFAVTAPEDSGTPDTPSSPQSPSSPTARDSRGSTDSDAAFSLIPDSPALHLSNQQKSRTLENRIKRKNKESSAVWQLNKQKSSEDLSSAKHRMLRRSVSEYVDGIDSGFSRPRRSNSEKVKSKKTEKDGRSFRGFFMGKRKDTAASDDLHKPKSSRSLPNRTFERIMSVRNKTPVKPPKINSGYTSDGDEGSVGGAHLKHDRNSAPSSPQLAASRSADSTPSKFNLWSRINKKTKGSFKPEKKNSRSEEGSTEISDGSLRSARSHESLQSCIQSHDSVLLHSSFHDRTRIQVNRDETRRTENTLMIWIMEAKDIPSKKKYFCRLKLNNELYRCTHKKQMTTMCFWGEYFELDSLPQVSTICIELMREADKKPTVKTIGSVEINVTLSSPGRAALIENWYLVKVEKQDRGDVPSIRIKHKFQSLDILPLVKYNALRSYLKDNSTSLCQLLEPAISVKAKEDIATTLIHIMQAEQRAVTFLVNLILIDTQKKAESEHLLFRGNSVATKAIEAYMKLVGEQYLCDLLSEPIYSLITTSEDLEVDPLRITSLQSLQRQREALKERVSEIWEKIIKSSTSFPVELRKVFHTLREHLAHQGKGEMTDHLISACVFLRFLCPAVLSPSLFNIVQEYPDEGVARNLTLVTKTLQTLANFTHFQGKESFMEFLNEFINKEQDRCRDFLQAISSPSDEDTSELEFSGDIDLGKHLALLHLHLIDALAKINTQGYESEASKVLALVEDISALLGDDCKENQPVTCHLPTLNPISTPPLVSNPSALATPTHLNNNYVRDYGDGNIGVGMVGGGIGAGYGVPITTVKSQSLPRSAPPIYQHHMEIPSPGLNSPYREKTAANDLSTNDDYVLITAFDHHAQPQNFMYPSVEANNNATLTDIRHSNGNTYFMAEVLPPDSPVCSSGSPAPYYTSAGQPPLRTYHHNQGLPRRHQRTVTTTSRSHSVQSPMERRGPYQEELSELYNFMDSCSHQIDAVCMDHENNIQGSQTSISQLSNVASSGYQSFAYSQSSSPVDSLLQTDNSSLLSRENGNPAQPILRQVLHGSPLASPLHQPAIGKHRAVAVHPAYLGHAGHVSLHGTPRHIPRVPQSKGSPNSSLSSSQSVEDLSSLRRGRTRQRRSASSSSDSSPESRPAMHAHSRRPNAHPPRTNPHCSPRLIPSPALRQELRSRSRCDRSVSGGRRGKNFRSCDREEFTRGTSHCYEDSEDDLAGMNYVSGGAGGGGGGGGGGGSWRRDGRRLSQEDYQCKSLAPQQILEQQEGQMRAIVEKLMTMEQEFRHEQEIMWKEMQDKDARIDAQAKKIAALDCANSKLIKTIATLGSRSEEMKGDIPDDINGDSCNASDTSDYKSSSC
ncbi:disabled homolog 2-interacting protein-like isoform X3 [Macrobrachium rosenbergii]|uniref:disabled homolog 2-interacting protein-like isoform X3 n=1 Tax=Macrobrachium rosenbergii TaxID=79674 RepID=UPI0034D40579